MALPSPRESPVLDQNSPVFDSTDNNLDAIMAPYSIEHYRMLKSREKEMDYTRFSRKSNRKSCRLSKTENQKFRSRNGELSSIDTLMDYKHKIPATSHAYTTQKDSTNKADNIIETDYLLNNYFLSKVNKVRRNRVLTSMEVFEKDLERKRMMNQYLTQRSKSRYGMVVTTPKEVTQLEHRNPKLDSARFDGNIQNEFRSQNETWLIEIQLSLNDHFDSFYLIE